MNKYTQFALNHYLSWYDPELTFEEILAACVAEDSSCVTPSEAYQHLTLEEISDDIYQMACDLEELL